MAFELTMDSPVGITLSRKGHTVGRLLGTGAQASVHVVLDPNGQESPWAVKLAPVPLKTTRKQNSIPEINANSIFKESNLSQNRMTSLKGRVIPSLPGPSTGLAVYSKAEGYCLFIMERMEMPLLDAIPQASTDLTAIARQLVSSVETVHQTRNLLVDVKTDNFMICHGNDKTIDQRVRIVDLGLIRPFLKAHSTDGRLLGTPLYASLHMHMLETPSRRDDLECLLYVIAELIICAHQGGQQSSKKPQYLPWANGKSDEEIYESKQRHVKNVNSDFYKRMPPKAQTVIHNCLKMVWELDFNAEPDYEGLKRMLTIVIPKKKQQQRASKAAPVAKKARSASTTQRRATTSAAAVPTTSSARATRAALRASLPKEAPTRRASTNKRSSTRFRLEDSSEEEEDSPPKKSKTIEEDDDDYSELEDVEMEAVDSGMEGYDTAEEDERKPAAQRRGAVLRIVEGSHKGESIELIEGSSEIVVIGKKPKTKRGEKKVVLSDDDALDDSHVKLVLAASVGGVNAIDLKSSTGTFVRDKKLPSGKEKMTFSQDSIRVGSTVMKVGKLVEKAVAMQEEEVSDVDLSGDEVEAMEVEEETRKPAAAQQRLGAMLRIVEGPHEGESIELIDGTDKDIIVGKKPKGKRGAKKLVLSEDDALDDSHVKLVLSSTKRSPCQVSVVDLKSSSGTFVRGSTLPSGKEMMAFAGDSIRAGSTKMKVCKLAPTGEDGPAVASSTMTNQRRKSRATEAGIAPVAAKENVPSDKPYMILKITEGPYDGESIDLKQGKLLCVGTKPTKKGVGIALPDDEHLEKNHARFEMKVLKYGGMSVEVVPLDGDVWVRDKKVPKKGTMAFRGDTIKMGGMGMVLQKS